MTSLHMPASPRATAARHAANEAVLAMIGLIRELTGVIDTENRQLAEGLPASASDLAARKSTLADALSRWADDVRCRQIAVADADPELRRRLRDCGAALGGRMHENLDRLRGSMASTRRRIDAIMQAIREQGSPQATGYGADGRVAVPRSGSSRVANCYL